MIGLGRPAGSRREISEGPHLELVLPSVCAPFFRFCSCLAGVLSGRVHADEPAV